MSDQFNKLSPAEHERLAILLEELGEAQQVIGKILRHGYESFNPCGDQGITNRILLEREMGDVVHATDRLFDAGDLDKECVFGHAMRKRERVRRFLHHQPDALGSRVS